MLRWRKSWTIENLQGSIRKDLVPAERSVWSDLLDLCGLSRRWGAIERSEGMPYTNEELAHMFITPVDVVNSTIDKCLKEGRLQQNGDGVLIITHWDKYQANKAKKQNEASDIPLSAEDKQASQQGAAARLGYLHPDAAQRGIEAKQAEKRAREEQPSPYKPAGQTEPER